MAEKLRFWRKVESDSTVDLTFGDWPGVGLRFISKNESSASPVALRFGVEYSPVEVVVTPAKLAATLPGAALPPLTVSGAGEDFTPPVGATLSAALPAAALPVLAFHAADTVPAAVLLAALPAVTLSAPALAAAVSIDLAMISDVGPVVSAVSRASMEPAGSSIESDHQRMRRTATPAQARQQQSAPAACRGSFRQQQMQGASRASRARAAEGLPLAGSMRTAHAETLKQQRAARSAQQHGLPLGGGFRPRHAEYIRIRQALRSGESQGIGLHTGVSSAAQQALKTATFAAPLHQQMIPLPVGWWQATYPWPEPDTPDPSPPAHLRFCRLADGTAHLVFGCPNFDVPGGEIVIPVRRTYIVLNSATLTLAESGAPIQHTGLSLQLDADSWSWGWSATVPASYLDTLRPVGTDGFVEVIATVNGQSFRLLVETLQRDRRFGRADLKIGGRSRSAWLASPHAPVITRYNTESRTAQQLLNEALTENGVSIGWSIDWQITDWLVPAGAWSHQGSYIDAAVRIAESAGAVVQPHPTDQTLRIIHRYPAAPWDWAAASADIAIPEDVVTVEGISWSDKTRYDAVYLAGTILGHVKRTGTSGGTVAPMVTDPLITHADAARQRGRAILSDTGRQAQIKLTLPVLQETGIIQPGKLVQYAEQGVTRRGITRAVDVQCGWPAITQTVTVETHEL